MYERKYYEAYEDRYRQVHARHLQWASSVPTPIVEKVMAAHGITKASDILELGCGEGRDAVHLLNKGYPVTATDISPEVIRYCRECNPQFAEHFRKLDCLAGEWKWRHNFIYAVAVLHMLVEDADRSAFYRFFREHLKTGGIGLICAMGDGTMVRKSDISAAFELQERTHDATGAKMWLAGTSCRMVTWDTFLREIRESGLTAAEYGLTEALPDFPVMMYAVVV